MASEVEPAVVQRVMSGAYWLPKSRAQTAPRTTHDGPLMLVHLGSQVSDRAR